VGVTKSRLAKGIIAGWTAALVLAAGALAHAQQPAPKSAPAAPPNPTAVKYYPEPDRAPMEALQGKPAPELEDLVWVQGGPTTIAAQKGKVVLLVFWSRLCGPCLEALPTVRDLLAKYEKQGMVVVAIHDSIGPGDLKPGLDSYRIAFPVAIEGNGRKNTTHYAVRGYPYFTFIDRAGKLRYADVLYDSLEQATEELIKEPVPK
jgi:thiol-disulfide isomerase/thioredoxin